MELDIILVMMIRAFVGDYSISPALLLQEENLGNLVELHPALLAEILAHYDYGLL